ASGPADHSATSSSTSPCPTPLRLLRGRRTRSAPPLNAPPAAPSPSPAAAERSRTAELPQASPRSLFAPTSVIYSLFSVLFPAMHDTRIAIVTGASRGIGRSIAERLAADGRHLVLVSRSEAPLNDLKASIEAAGGAASVMAVDVGDSAAFGAAVEQIAAEHGR